MNAKQEPHYLVLGKIERPHGIRGELRVRVITDYPERILDMETVYIGDDPMQPEAEIYNIETVRFHQNHLLIKFAEIYDRDDADAMRNLLLLIDVEDAVPLEDDEVYLYQLIGMVVQLQDGTKLGKIKDVIETGANDVYVLKRKKQKDLLIPAHSETVLEINLEAGLVTVELPEGLLD